MDFAFDKQEEQHQGYANMGGSDVSNQSKMLKDMLSDAEIVSDLESHSNSIRKRVPNHQQQLEEYEKQMQVLK